MEKCVDRTRLFYRGKELATVRRGNRDLGIFRGYNQCLAEQDSDSIRLLCADENGSVLCVEDDAEREAHIFTAYGYAATMPSTKTLNGFNGEMLEPLIQSYLLGAGYRAFTPTLLRFHCPDNLSPFGLGGLNAYAYCNGDPVNTTDPSGHSGFFRRLSKGIRNRLGLRRPRQSPNLPTTAQAPSIAPQASSPEQNRRSRFPMDNVSVNTYSMISMTETLSSLHTSLSSSQSATSRFTTDNPERIPSGFTVGDIDSWVTDPRFSVNDPQLIPDDLTIDSVNASLVTQHNGRIKSKILKTAVEDFPADRGYIVNGKYYTSAQRIQNRIRRRNK
ncbi:MULTISPECIES: RHS repeat-associated core domain-containing protein [Pseudomonas]|uniref:RHS repeat-associated core domain-containing protein n=1 Tax=Pseudomonas TaxID=286 RepID=UPI001596AFE1|nr:RHS repeat-associated core domain-containing protein [Pseudomonas faucium]